MTPPEINLCYTNCERFGRSIYEEFIKNGRVKVSIYGCLGRCNVECKDSLYVEVLSPLIKILADENSSELVKKIKEHLNLE